MFTSQEAKSLNNLQPEQPSSELQWKYYQPSAQTLRGFIYLGSEIYGGLAGAWDYGPAGPRSNIKQLWWKMFVDDREGYVGVDALYECKL